MYKLSYYRYDELTTYFGLEVGLDRVRNVKAGFLGYKLNFFEEAFSSQTGLVRIYRKKPRSPRDQLRFISQTTQTLQAGQTPSEVFKYASKFISKRKAK